MSRIKLGSRKKNQSVLLLRKRAPRGPNYPCGLFGFAFKSENCSYYSPRIDWHGGGLGAAPLALSAQDRDGEWVSFPPWWVRSRRAKRGRLRGASEPANRFPHALEPWFL